VLERLEARDPGPAITLCAALVKFDHFEWMIEKATELGVSRILPVAAARSEKGLDQGARKRLERWRRIALESSQQCRRAHLPEILDPAAFGAALQAEASLRLFLDETGGGEPILKALSPAPSGAVFVGPEGGWTEAERGEALAAGWKAVSLGSNILRAETAALAALAVMGCSLRG
jgi:16S rRNA (uracil1498-N3)-methyltransferase